jgi:hypothetical protein
METVKTDIFRHFSISSYVILNLYDMYRLVSRRKKPGTKCDRKMSLRRGLN